MNISVRFFLGYFLIVGLAVWFILNLFNQEIEPSIRQATEETLVDTAHVLAEMAAPDLAHQRLPEGSFVTALNAARHRAPHASIFGVNKDSIDFRVYITDAKGIVVYDSEGLAQGADYSQWRDVARVLKGEYGARSTRDNPSDPTSSVLYVAAPIFWEEERIGVISVAKPVHSILPYVSRSEARIRRESVLLLILSAAIGLAFSLWLTWSISRLRAYARDVSAGKKAIPPTTGGRQFSELAQALAEMREQLEGKQYVEKYVQNLAHELKSPLSAVSGAAELLQENPPEPDRKRFIHSITEQARRMQQTIERMLKLARVEQLQAPEERTRIGLTELVEQSLDARKKRLEAHQLTASLRLEGFSQSQPEHQPQCLGDRFLLQQALFNLLDNAIDFSPPGSHIQLTLHEANNETNSRNSKANGQVCLCVQDQGSGAPEYALPHLFERFYSLPRPDNRPKSTGLGLPFVREVARLHGGEAFFRNRPEGGAEVCICLPLAS